MFIIIFVKFIQRYRNIIMKSKIFIMTAAAILALFSCNDRSNYQSDNSGQNGNDNHDQDTTQVPPIDSTLAFNPNDLPEEPLFEIYTTEGTITIMLYKDTPLHRDNFVKLASERFYDSLLFHRVIHNFMIQTGDPLTKDPANKPSYGTGGPGYTIPAEILPNHTHKKGALAAARKGDTANPQRESSGSQFYIVHNPDYCSHLDGQYTVFGETLDGFDVIDRIASAQTDSRDCPVNDIRIISIMPII